MSDMGIRGMTPEVEGYMDADRVSDGTVGQTRAQHTEAEMTRDDGYVKLDEVYSYGFGGEIRETNLRDSLLRRASKSPAILREYSLTPTDDRLLVKYASFREGYVCTACDGEGHGVQNCTNCQGTKKVHTSDRFGKTTSDWCHHCRVTGSESLEPKVTGFEPCANCNGTGLARGVLAVPDEAKRDHSYGDIISIGDQVYDLAPGDRVCFSKMAGIHIHNDKVDTNKRETHYCLLRRGEVMGLMLRV